jgi:hypothetical protein
LFGRRVIGPIKPPCGGISPNKQQRTGATEKPRLRQTRPNDWRTDTMSALEFRLWHERKECVSKLLAPSGSR